MTPNFFYAQRFTAAWEGGDSDHPADRGGTTKYGVSLAFLRATADEAPDVLAAVGIALPITRETVRRLTVTQAQQLFARRIWDSLHLDDLPPRMATLLYDAAVNHGRGTAVKLAQRGYNACVRYGTPLAVDSLLGPLTRAALRNTDTPAVRGAIIDARISYYHAIARNDDSQQVFLRGWLNRAADLRRYVEAD